MRRAPRIGIVGARRARQGLGPFVAKWLARHGADVVAHAGTSAATVDMATAELARVAGVRARGHVGVAAMLGAEDLDAVAILSPPERHGDALEACLAAGLHTLCEKPLLPLERAERASEFEQSFASQSLLLWENCQWPRTLATFRALFPRAPQVPRAFTMGLEPASHGATMLTDALSHPLSLLQALLGPSLRVAEVTVGARRHGSAAEPTEYTLEFRASGERGDAAARVELRHNAVQPRRAWYTLDGSHAERTIAVGDYTMSFEDRTPGAPRGRAVVLPDPLERHLAEFVAALRGEPHDPEGAAVALACGPRLAALATLVASAHEAQVQRHDPV